MKYRFSFLFICLLLVMSSCSYLPGPSTGEEPVNQATQQALIEQAVQGTATASALQTQISELKTQLAQFTSEARETIVVVTATSAPVTATVESPTPTPVPPTPTVTPVTPTATPVTPSATATPVTPTPTATSSIACNEAKFEADVTVPDGTTFAPGASFTKTWRLRNSGSCTWTTAYDLVFVSGDQLGSPNVVDLPANVAPGQVIDLSVNMIAPSTAGGFRSNWKLRDASGILFGLGKQGVSFYADIRVSTTALSLPVSLASIYCSAEWTSGGSRLACPGKDGDSAGFVFRIDKPVLESGYQDDEPALLTQPQMITDSVIRGKFPAIRVEKGYHFSSVIGCANKSTGCDVNFQLDYQIGNGSITTLKTWHEVYDEKYVSVDVDLSSLAGKDVRLILSIFSNGSASNDRAQWLAPRIYK